MNIENIKKEIEEKIEQIVDLKEIEALEKEYKTQFRKLSTSMKDLAKEERKEFGITINQISKDLEKDIKQKKESIKQELLSKKEELDFLDISLPAKKIQRGHIHPLTKIRKEMEDIFQLMGFSIVEGPDIEDEWHNFDALNVPEDHPAREMQDTFFVKQKNKELLPNIEKLVLRTHTSNLQTRYMEKNNPPLRIIAPGRVYRYEATDASHEVCFYQIEGLLVDKDVSVANLKFTLEKFLQEFFKSEVEVRLRPSFFPFVEPGFEVDMTCTICEGKGCSFCSQTGWIEILGAGMVHPNVLKNCGLNPNNWTGFAFGVSIDRLAMMKYKIDDIRWFHKGDLRFLKQF
jgi:phenylalanyl-tRNA synthetase alpha chain